MSEMTPRERRYRSLTAVSVLAILCFVLILEFLGDSEYKSLAILVALGCWLIAALVMVFSAPRYLLHIFRDRFGLLGGRKSDDDPRR
jgi:hypothetical protein